MALGDCDSAEGDFHEDVSRAVSVAATDSHSLWRHADPVRCTVNPDSVYWSHDVIPVGGIAANGNLAVARPSPECVLRNAEQFGGLSGHHVLGQLPY